MTTMKLSLISTLAPGWAFLKGRKFKSLRVVALQSTMDKDSIRIEEQL